ncbi:MAG: flagellar motor switch protein FliG [Deltaproteobacteria bacterium]|jgi:flagellar motor switch protein FliG
MTTEYTGVEKAAVVFIHLGEELANDVFQNLTRREIKLLHHATRKVASFTADQVEACLESFVAEMQAISPELKSGSAFIAQLATQNLGSQRAREYLGDATTGLNDTLAELDARTISSLVKKEHPQTVSLILAHLPPERGAEVLAMLPDQLQPDVIRRLAKIDQVSPEVVDLLEQALVSEIARMGKGLTQKVGGIHLVADIMNNLDKSVEQSLMNEVQEADEELAEEVRSLMFVFDDLIYVDGGGIQTLLKEVERDTLVMALKAAGDELKDHFFSNLSARAAEMIADDMENRGLVRLSEVEKAQSEVVRVALNLAQNGAIDVNKSSNDELV